MAHIFISYSKQDIEFARHLRQLLTMQGFVVWMDETGLAPSNKWWLTIEANIISCAAFIIIMSPESKGSDWVEREILLAEEYAKPIFPILLSGNRWSRLAERQYENMTDGIHAKLSASLVQTLGQIVSISDTQTVPPSPPAEQAEVQKRIEEAAQPNDGWTPQIEVTDPPQAVSPEKQAELNEFMRRANETKQAMEAEQPAQPTVWGFENILPPPFEWVYIPPGNVTIGGEIFSVDAFNIAKYPITHAQYKTFIQAHDGYQNLLWWNDTADSREWYTKFSTVRYEASTDTRDNPVVNVSWYEAMAFCKWLAHRFNSNARELSPVNFVLPTEQQWLRAAQGDDGRKYPWGIEFDQTRCNTAESRMGHTTSVTKYLQGASPYGVMDMSGNVSELCLHVLNYYAGIRGGSWKTDANRASVAHREDIQIGKRLETIGFRIVMMNMPIT